MTNHAQPNGQDDDRLDSWKAIAAYLGKGVRTAIRWSQDEGMPVYRHAGSKRGAVYAYRSEIDAWIHSDRSADSPPRRKPVFIWAVAIVVLAMAVTGAFFWLKPTPEPLGQVTTSSPAALRFYSRGMQDMYLGRWDGAETLFRQALDEDREFASANLFVFWALANQGKESGGEARSFLQHAMDLADSVSEQERLFIQGTYYSFVERNPEKACGSYKTLAELFPAHYWATGNALFACGMDLGHRGEYVRYAVQAAERRPELTVMAAAALTYLEKDFDRARPYVRKLKTSIADGETSGWPRWARAWSVSFTEFFPAEEYLAKGMLQEVEAELRRVELALGSMDATVKPGVVRNLVHFHLALGQLQKAEKLGKEYYLHGMLQSWLAYLAKDQAAYRAHLEEFRASLRKRFPDPVEREMFVLGWNIGGVPTGFPIDVLVPLYEPEAALHLASSPPASAPSFISLPKFEAKVQLALGKQLLDQERMGEAAEHLWNGVQWFRDYGDPGAFPYYFLGAELLAVASLERGDLQTAFRDLDFAAGQGALVHSLTAPLHQRIQARLALLNRELGRIAEAEAIEAELANALRIADTDHPILVQIREQQDIPVKIE